MKLFRSLAVVLFVVPAAYAELKVPALFTDHMVLQRDHKCPVWGWAKPGLKVQVTIDKQKHNTKADAKGAWRVKLDPLKTGGPHTLTIATDQDTIAIKDVLVGEVWICSGQSNMAWPVQAANDPDLESLSAKFPKIRLISVPQVGTQIPQDNFNGKWELCTPESVKQFSAVGYFFGRQLHQTLGVPIGLIDNAWGGSAAEAWVPRAKLEADPRYKPLLDRWAETERTFKPDVEQAKYAKRLDAWKKRAAAARAANKPIPRRPRFRNPLIGQHRPANLWNGVLNPLVGYGIRGTVWYQGESNSARAYQYRHLFPLMIQSWRDAWGQGELPFYWVQLADFQAEAKDPGDIAWAELREAQTMTLDKLANTGEAVIIDLGEAADIHPRNKQDVAKRLARIALARDYGIKVAYQSPRLDEMEINAGKALLTFKHIERGLKPFDVREVRGFAVAGADKKWRWANARVLPKSKTNPTQNRVVVWSDEVKQPVAVRYAWGSNPVANLRALSGLPVTPFRTDDWPGVTIDNHK